MMLRLWIAAIATAALSSTAVAQTGFTVSRAPIRHPGLGDPIQIGQEHAGSCDQIYLNNVQSGSVYWTLNPNEEIADDLHTTATGDWPLCAFDLGYQKLSAGTVDATVTFYRNNPADGGVGAIISGPWLVAGMPGGGAYLVHVEVPGGIVGPDVWMGVRFSQAESLLGVLTANPPAIGSSHDLVAFQGGIVNSPSGNNPPGNLFMAVYASRPTGTLDATWGQVKSIYR